MDLPFYGDHTPAYGARLSPLLAALALDYLSALLLRLSAAQVLGRSSARPLTLSRTRALSHSAALLPYRLLLRLACPALCRVEISAVSPVLGNSGVFQRS